MFLELDVKDNLNPIYNLTSEQQKRVEDILVNFKESSISSEYLITINDSVEYRGIKIHTDNEVITVCGDIVQSDKSIFYNTTLQSIPFDVYLFDIIKECDEEVYQKFSVFAEIENKYTFYGMNCSDVNNVVKNWNKKHIDSVSFNYSLITSLNSSVQLQDICIDSKKCGDGLVVLTKDLFDKRDEILFGFDEVWVFAHDNISPKPNDCTIVGPEKINKSKVYKLGEWLIDNDCLLGMGDGAGLNYISKIDW